MQAAPDGAGVPLVSLREVGRRFGDREALAGISFDIVRGEVLGIIGRSGAGKSTLLRCLAGLERPDRGQIVLDGDDLAALPERGLASHRRRIGLVFQHFNLLSSRTALGNVALPLKIAGIGRTARSRRAEQLLALVGLAGEGALYPSQLSGGQKQRVGIARALAAEPALLLCDEPTSALDPETTRAILDLLADINRRLGLTIVLITHEMAVVRRIAQRVIVLDAGRIAEAGEVGPVFAQPRSEATRRLLADVAP